MSQARSRWRYGTAHILSRAIQYPFDLGGIWLTYAYGQVKRHAQELRVGSSDQVRLKQVLEDLSSLSGELSGQGVRELQQLLCYA